MTINKGLVIRKLEEAKKALYSDELAIPISVFSSNMAPLEAIVYYLRDSMNMKNVEVARILNRSVKSTTQAYKNAQKKLS